MTEIETPQGPAQPEVFSNLNNWLVNHGIQEDVSRQLAEGIRDFYPTCAAHCLEDVQMIGISARTVEPPDNWTINLRIVPAKPLFAHAVDPIREIELLSPRTP